MASDLHDVIIEIGGAPDQRGRDPERLSVRRRLHKLESDRAAADAATAAVRAATELRQSAHEKRFSRREKIGGLLLAAAVVVSTWLSPLFFHH